MVVKITTMEDQVFMYFQIYKIFILIILINSLCACSSIMMPYSDELKCSGTYKGKCQSVEDAYNDSKADIDPRMYDKEWLEKKKEWMEENKALVEARKQNQIQADNQIAPTYRKELFRELTDVIQEPETPMVIPPRIVRGLVLNVARDEMFVASHYVYFMIDKPKWVLRKIPEIYVPSPPQSKYLHDEKVIDDALKKLETKKEETEQADCDAEAEGW